MPDNFQRTLKAVKVAAAQAPFRRILFVRPADEPRTYMYASSPADGGDYALAPYIAPRGTGLADLLSLDAKIKDVSSADAAAATRPGDLVVTLAPDLSLEKLARSP